MHRSKLWPPSELEGCWACRTQTQWEGRRKPSRENHPMCQTWIFFTRKTTKSSQTSIWKYLFGSLLKMSAMWTQLPLEAMAPRELLLKSRFDFQGKSHKGWEGSAFFFLLKTFHREEKKTPTTRKSKLKMWTVGSVPKEAWLMLAGDAWWDAGLAAYSALVQDWAAWPMWKATSRFNISFWFWVS